jgi:hypothetical protein
MTWKTEAEFGIKSYPQCYRLRTNVNRAIRDTHFNLVYGVEAVLAPEIYLESAMVAHFNTEDQTEARELDSNLLEERRNTALANVWKYQASLKRYYNKSVVPRELNVGNLVLKKGIGNLVLKKGIRTRDKHKFSSSWEWPFIIVEQVAPGAYVLAEVDSGMLPNTWNADQLHKYYVWCINLINKDTSFLIIHLSVCYFIFRSIDRRSLSAHQRKW